MYQTPSFESPKPLLKGFDREAFDCGVPVLNEYLKKFALQNQKKDAARTYVVTNPANQILGYYTLVFGAARHEDVPNHISAGLGKYQIPILLLARLAVDVSQRRKGLGGILLRNALLQSVRASEIAGLRAVMVHAKDQAARSFYEGIGFKQAPSEEFRLFLQISDVRSNLP